MRLDFPFLARRAVSSFSGHRLVLMRDSARITLRSIDQPHSWGRLNIAAPSGYFISATQRP